MSEFVTEINDSDFASFTGEGLVLIDFWAPWCGPCKMMGPVIDEVAQKVTSYAKIGKINVDENTAAATEFGVQSIPTLIIFKNGKEVARSIGACSEDDLLSKLDAHK